MTQPENGALEPIVQAYADQASPTTAAAGQVGVVVGAVRGDRTAIAGTGALDGRTVFRIASLSKPFTGVALAAAVGRGELDLSDLVNDRLPPSVRLPDPPVTLEHLATHRSGLPRGIADAAEGQTLADFANALAEVEPIGAPGQACAYSNLGAALVGLVLGHRAGRTYDELIRSTVGEPLGLTNVVEWPDSEQRSRLATGHDENGQPCQTPTYPTGVAAGGLYGTTADLLRFVRAHWASDTPADLATALRLASTPRAEAFEDNRIGLFWLVGTPPGDQDSKNDQNGQNGTEQRAVWHNGALPGYRSYLAFVPEREIGVAVLSNTALPIDHVGSALLGALVS